jgi:hypothetical protein
VTLPYDEARARASVSLAIETAQAYGARVKRIYLYQWRADPGGRFDAGLVRPDGTPRPDAALRGALPSAVSPDGAAPAPPVAPREAGAPGTTIAAPTGHPVPSRVVVPANGRARIGLRCARGARCIGRVWVGGASHAAGLLVSGRPPAEVLQPVGVRFALRAGRSAGLRFRVPRAIVERAERAAVLRLRLGVTSAEEPFALLGRYRATLRPRRPGASHRARR